MFVTQARKFLERAVKQIQAALKDMEDRPVARRKSAKAPTRKLSAAGREAISRAAKKRWREYRRSRS